MVVGVGIVGMGRAGWGIHGRTLARLGDMFDVTAVVSREEARRSEAQAAFSCAAYRDAAALADDENVDLVVVATPSHIRSEVVIPLLERGKDVLVEKPFATSLAEADAMFAAAEQHSRLLTCSQNRRYSADFLRIRDLMEIGAVGELVEIKIAWHSFRRRWDWQTLRRCGGGALNNDGSHVVDQALLLIGAGAVDVNSRMVRTNLTAGDAEDHVKIVLSTDSGLIVDIEVSNSCAYPQESWLVLGTAGGISLSGHRLRWKSVDLGALPPRTAQEGSPTDRTYGSEDLAWTERSEELPVEEYTDSHVRLYSHLYQVLTGDTQLEIEPAQIRRQVEVLDRCRMADPVVIAP
jgi:predicted dehydrogenase